MKIATTKMWREYIMSWNSHDIEKLLSFFTDDCVYEDLATAVVKHGKDELRDLLKDLFVSIPDVQLEFKSIFRSGGWAAMEWVMSGTYTGHSNIAKIAPTGKSFSVRAASILELRGDKISRNSDYWNFASFRQQIGSV
jgi:steroid delta-isomerase-like uncharacterized protein